MLRPPRFVVASLPNLPNAVLHLLSPPFRTYTPLHTTMLLNNNKQQQPVAYQQVGQQQQQQQGYQPPQPVQGAYALPPDQQGTVYTQPQTILCVCDLAMLLFIVRRRTLRTPTDSRSLRYARYARNRTSRLFRYAL